MLLGLPAPALVRGDDEQDQTDRSHAGQHVRDEPLVSRDVDEPDLPPGGELAPRVAEVDREPAPLLFLPAVGIHPGQTDDQRGLAVVDMAGRGHDAELGHLPVGAVTAFVVIVIAVHVVIVLLVPFERVHARRERDGGSARPSPSGSRGGRSDPSVRANAAGVPVRRRAANDEASGTWIRTPHDGRLVPGIDPPPTADSHRTTRAPSSSPPIVSERSCARLRTISGDSRSIRNTGSSASRPVAVIASTCSRAAICIRPMRTARAIGCRRSRSSSAARPTMMPAWGPPSSLSAENVTRSAPCSNASETAGSSSGCP